MAIYLSRSEAITDMQEKGFTEDFQLFGTDLLWLNRKVFLRPSQFQIVELHRFLDISGNEKIVFGIEVTSLSIKGILSNHFKKYTNEIPAVINLKLLQMDSKHLNKAYDYVDVVFQHKRFNGDPQE